MPWTQLSPSLAQAAEGSSLGLPLVEEGKTLAVLREELRLALGGRGDAADRLDGWINDAYVDLCSSLQIEELKGAFAITTVVGQPLYLLPPTVETIQAAAIVLDASALRDGYPLDKIDLMSYRSMALRADEPTAYFRLGQMLVLWPTPTSVRTIALDARIKPEELVEDADSPMIPRMWHEGIFLLARQKAYNGLQEFEKAALASNDFVDFVRRKQDRNANEDENRVVASSVPRRLGELRNTVHRADAWEDF